MNKQIKVCINNTYLSSEDFRNKIENYIKNILLGKEIIDVKTASVKELQEYLKELRSEYRGDDQCSYIPDNLTSNEDLYLWAKEMERVLNKDLLYDDICSIEDEIKRRYNIKNYNSSNVLYIHKSNNIKCHIRKHNLVSATAIVKGRQTTDVNLNVNHCTTCDKYLISYSEFIHYRDLYGIL